MFLDASKGPLNVLVLLVQPLLPTHGHSLGQKFFSLFEIVQKPLLKLFWCDITGPESADGLHLFVED